VRQQEGHIHARGVIHTVMQPTARSVARSVARTSSCRVEVNPIKLQHLMKGIEATAVCWRAPSEGEATQEEADRSAPTAGWHAPARYSRRVCLHTHRLTPTHLADHGRARGRAVDRAHAHAPVAVGLRVGVCVRHRCRREGVRRTRQSAGVRVCVWGFACVCVCACVARHQGMPVSYVLQPFPCVHAAATPPPRPHMET
jgi:hypothetical protein